MFSHPFTLILCGATSSGKTRWLMRLIKYNDQMIDPPPRKIIYSYTEINDTVLQLKQQGHETFNGLPDIEKIKAEGPNLLLILDDQMLNVSNDYLETLFTRGSHHWGTSVIFVTQSIFGKNIRIARNNTHYLVLMRSAQAELQARTIGSQLFPKKINYFMESFHDATKEPYTYLLINMHPKTPDYLRLSTNVFPDEKQKIYMPIDEAI